MLVLAVGLKELQRGFQSFEGDVYLWEKATIFSHFPLYLHEEQGKVGFFFDKQLTENEDKVCRYMSVNYDSLRQENTNQRKASGYRVCRKYAFIGICLSKNKSKIIIRWLFDIFPGRLILTDIIKTLFTENLPFLNKRIPNMDSYRKNLFQ